MASLTAKVIKGRTYYYARECRRVDGRPKVVRTVYLGTSDFAVSILERLAKRFDDSQSSGAHTNMSSSASSGRGSSV